MNKDVVENGKPEKKIVISFDDGPHPQYTLQICELLEKFNIKALFFFLGSMAEKYPEIIKKVHEKGHEIGNHGYTHLNLRWKSKKIITEEIMKTDTILQAIIKKETNYFRPPYLRCGLNLLLILRKMKKKMVLATVSTKDFKRKNPEIIVKKALRKTQNKAILVFHDGGKNQEITMKALEILIPELLARGFRFVQMEELSKC
jgi:peptidoglycan/xylan/chitin deacetylase (PgdA/CDA1 family)